MKLRKLLPILGIGIFILIFLKLDINKIFNEIIKVNLFYIFLAFVLTLFSLLLQTFKWYIIARFQKIELPFLDAFELNLISLFYGFLTPARVGGVVRAEYMKDYKNGGVGKGLSNYSLDKILDLASIFFLVVVFSFSFGNIINKWFFYYSLILLVLLIVSLVLFLDKERSRNILGVFYRRILPQRLKESAKKGFYSFYKDIPKKRYFILFFIINLLAWVSLYLVSYVIGIALGIEISFIYYLVILPIGTLVSLIPISISGLGTREAVMISLFGLLNVAGTKVFSMSLLNIFIAGVIPSIIGSFLIFKYRESK
jgi:hypothetical protein